MKICVMTQKKNIMSVVTPGKLIFILSEVSIFSITFCAWICRNSKNEKLLHINVNFKNSFLWYVGKESTFFDSFVLGQSKVAY